MFETIALASRYGILMQNSQHLENQDISDAKYVKLWMKHLHIKIQKTLNPFHKDIK